MRINGHALTETLIIAVTFGLALSVPVTDQDQTVGELVSQLWQQWLQLAEWTWSYLLLLGWALG